MSLDPVPPHSHYISSCIFITLTARFLGEKSKKKDWRKIQLTLCLILIQEVQPSQLGCEIPRAKTRDIFPKLFNLKRFRGEANKLVLKSRGPKQTLYIESFFHVSLQSSHFWIFYNEKYQTCQRVNLSALIDMFYHSRLKIGSFLFYFVCSTVVWGRLL